MFGPVTPKIRWNHAKVTSKHQWRLPSSPQKPSCQVCHQMHAKNRWSHVKLTFWSTILIQKVAWCLNCNSICHPHLGSACAELGNNILRGSQTYAKKGGKGDNSVLHFDSKWWLSLATISQEASELIENKWTNRLINHSLKYIVNDVVVSIKVTGKKYDR